MDCFSWTDVPLPVLYVEFMLRRMLIVLAGAPEWTYSSYVFFFLLSLDVHNHVDDYSGTLGGVGKFTFQLWSQVLKIELLHCHSLSVSLRKRKKRRRKKEN